MEITTPAGARSDEPVWTADAAWGGQIVATGTHRGGSAPPGVCRLSRGILRGMVRTPHPTNPLRHQGGGGGETEGHNRLGRQQLMATVEGAGGAKKAMAIRKFSPYASVTLSPNLAQTLAGRAIQDF